MPTSSLHYVTTNTPSDASDLNQYADVLTGTAGSTGITITGLAVNGTQVTFIGNTVSFNSLGGTSLVIGAGTTVTGFNPDQITLSSGPYNGTAGTVTIAATAGAGGDTNINIRLTPLGSGVIDIHYPTTALGGGSSATLGTIGGSGPTTAAQNSWVSVLVNGVAGWLPLWH
jgi:hypothetical protein